MSGLKTFLTISSFAFLIAAGVLVVVSAGLLPGGDGTARGARSSDGSRLDLVTHGSGQKDQELRLLLALKVFGSGSAARDARPGDTDRHAKDHAPGSKPTSAPSS